MTAEDAQVGEGGAHEDPVLNIARRLEAIEDDLHQIDGMEEYREPISEVRIALVNDLLEEATENWKNARK